MPQAWCLQEREDWLAPVENDSLLSEMHKCHLHGLAVQPDLVDDLSLQVAQLRLCGAPRFRVKFTGAPARRAPSAPPAQVPGRFSCPKCGHEFSQRRTLAMHARSCL